MDVSKDAGREVDREPYGSATRKENHVFQDKVALMRITRAWQETRWTYSTGRRDCIKTGAMLDRHERQKGE